VTPSLPVSCSLALAAAAVAASPGEARAQTFDAGPYVGISAGGILFQDLEGTVAGESAGLDFAPGYALAAQLGYRFSVLRAELELEYGAVDLDVVEAAGVSADLDGELNVLRGTAGLYADFTLLPLITPYVGGGIGAAHIDGDSAVIEGVTVEVEDDTHLTVHGEVGLALDFFPFISIVPAYRYIWIDSGDDNIDDATAHVFKLGARLEF
jgi:opacity protein-like surface antigen